MPPGAEPPILPAGDAADARATMARIAAPFDRSRERPWPQVAAFLGPDVPGPVLDLAAGNARHALVAARQGVEVVALDAARSVLARGVAGARPGARVHLVEADALRLPLRDAVFPTVLFIAGVHCIRGRGRRLAALREMTRVLRPGGRALVSAWTKEQDRFRAVVEEQRARIWELRAAHTRRGLTGPPPEVGDVDVPWSHGVPESVSRFFHLYDAWELRDDLNAAGLRVEGIEAATLTRSSQPDNLFATVRRP